MTGEGDAVLRNVRYCSGGSACCSHTCNREDPLNKHLLDVYLPEKEIGCRPPPVVFFVHGGGWRRGHKNGWKHYLSSYDTNLFVYLLLRLFGVYDNVGRAFSRAGVACVVPSYRLTYTPCHLFAAELCISLFFSLATVFPVVWATSRALTNTVMLAPYSPEDGREGGLPFCTVLNASILVLWVAMTLRHQYYGKCCLLALWSSLAVMILVRGNHSISVLTSDSFPHTVILLSVTYVTLFVNYVSTITSNESSTKEALLDIKAAYQWTVDYGLKTGLYDVHRLYLCGHSAGAHLALLAMLQGQIGADNTSCIKVRVLLHVNLSAIHYCLIAMHYSVTLPSFLGLSLAGFYWSFRCLRYHTDEEQCCLSQFLPQTHLWSRNKWGMGEALPSASHTGRQQCGDLPKTKWLPHCTSSGKTPMSAIDTVNNCFFRFWLGSASTGPGDSSLR